MPLKLPMLQPLYQPSCVCLCVATIVDELMQWEPKNEIDTSALLLLQQQPPAFVPLRTAVNRGWTFQHETALRHKHTIETAKWRERGDCQVDARAPDCWLNQYVDR